MPSLTPVVERTETLSGVTEGTEVLTPLTEGAETLVALSELTNETLPALYPSLNTYPSVAGTFPSPGSPDLGLALAALAEGTETLTPLLEV